MWWQKLKQQFGHRPGVRRNAIFAGFLLIAILITSATIEQIDRNRRLESQVTESQRQQTFLEQQIANQRLENQFYQTDHYIELEARRQFGLVAEGESLINLQQRRIDDRLAQWHNSSKPLPPPKTSSNWQLWWQFFWGREPRPTRDSP